jgi:ligand-binding sensor domain-containing protein
MNEVFSHRCVFRIRAVFLFFLIAVSALACRNENLPSSAASGRQSGKTSEESGSKSASSSAASDPAVNRIAPRIVNFETDVNVKTLALDGDYLWMGLPSGIIRYDTRTKDQYQVYTTRSTGGGLLSKGIYKIKIDPQGNKWIGSYGGGLTKYDGKTWHTYTPNDGLGDLWVYDMAFDAQGRMWVATWKGVSVFDGKRFKTYTVKDGLADKWVYAIGLDHDGQLWFGTESGVSRFDGKTWKNYTHADGLGADVGPPPVVPPAIERMKDPTDTKTGEYGSEGNGHHMGKSRQNTGPNPNFIIAVEVDNQNNKWFGTWGAGLSKFDGKTWTTYTTGNGLGGNFVHAVTLDRDGSIWVGTNGGVSRFDGKEWTTISIKDGLIDDNVFSIVVDDSGNKWFGTWRGLSKLAPS